VSVEGLFKTGRVVAVVLQLAALIAVLPWESAAVAPGSPQPVVLCVFCLYVIAASALSVVVHEAGHALACRVLGAQIKAVYLGNGLPGRRRLTIGKVVITLDMFSGGRVEHSEARTAGRRALITAAGALANLIVAGALLAVFWRGAGTSVSLGTAVAVALAIVMSSMGLANLMPYRTRAGRPTDGARLLALALGGPFAEAVRASVIAAARTAAAGGARVRDANGWLVKGAPRAMLTDLGEYERDAKDPARPPQPERTTRWLGYYAEKEIMAWMAVGIIGKSLRREGRTAELLALQASVPMPAGEHTKRLTISSAELAYQVLLLPAPPAAAVARALDQLQWAHDKFKDMPEFAGKADYLRASMQHNRALGQLRLGQPAGVEELCRTLLERPDLPADSRAETLATIVLARRALGEPYEQLLAEAEAVAPASLNDLVQELIQEAATVPPA
jgi:Peptidase family M50